MTGRDEGSLRAIGVGVRFAGLEALSDVSLTLVSGEIVGLIGPNGAGKTTLVNVLSGFQRPTSGQVLLGERNVTALPPQKLAAQGLGRTFQSVRLFGRLTVFDNVLAGAIAGGMRMRPARELTWTLLERLSLAHTAAVSAAALPQGEERRLGIIRALAGRPRFLLLDEPAAGLNERETEALTETLAMLPRDFGLGLLVIEHDMALILGLCHRIQVLDHGKTIAEGSPRDVRHNRAVIEAYLGAGAVTERSADAEG
ncbi:MAG: branched-chain amino acid transport system ATP-binding protein [Gaiellaceae bacterium]|nr:branched-chain amino acid transport system ATP-binding protein [Gaiellaceae bacterium]